MEINNPPIEKAFVHYNNDPSVGMFPFGFELGVHILSRDKEELDEIREKISELYELIEGERPDSVKFDFELQQEYEAEKAMDEQLEKYEMARMGRTDDF